MNPGLCLKDYEKRAHHKGTPFCQSFQDQPRVGRFQQAEYETSETSKWPLVLATMLTDVAFPCGILITNGAILTSISPGRARAVRLLEIASR